MIRSRGFTLYQLPLLLMLPCPSAEHPLELSQHRRRGSAVVGRQAARPDAFTEQCQSFEISLSSALYEIFSDCTHVSLDWRLR
jgi:hypothetical protein